MSGKDTALEIIKKIIPLIVLIFILLFILTWSGLIKCQQVPGWCDVYWGIMGQPQILITYSGDGLGDPFKLEDIFNSKNILNVRPNVRDIQTLTSGVISKYEMVIVTQAKTLSFEQMEMFLEYANGGGILVWTGDAGTRRPADELNPQKYKMDDNSPWVRVNDSNKVMYFNNKISADYLGNFCDIVHCTTDNEVSNNAYYSGNLKYNSDSIIAQGLRANAELRGNFAIVEVINNTTTKKDLLVDHMAELISRDPSRKKFGTLFTIIVTSGVGDKIIYSAVPLEYFVDLDTDNGYLDDRYLSQNTGMFYPKIIENLYANAFGK
jgi:hypothetical protein